MKRVALLGFARRRMLQAALFLVFFLGLSGTVLLPAADTSPVNPHKIPMIDGGIGPCSVQFTVRNESGSPVYNSRIHVHISYGLFGAHKLDLEVGTNIDGKAGFTGLPNRVKDPLYFKASQGKLEGSAVFDPADGCKMEHVIVLTKAPDDSSQP